MKKNNKLGFILFVGFIILGVILIKPFLSTIPGTDDELTPISGFIGTVAFFGWILLGVRLFKNK